MPSGSGGSQLPALVKGFPYGLCSHWYLDALVEQNVISEEDKMYVGYNRIGVRDVGLGITSRYSPDPEAMNCREGDMLAYVKYQSQIIYEPPTECSERSKSLYRKIAAIMEQMERNR